MIVAYVVAGTGVLILIVVVLTVLPRLRRVTRAVDELRAGLERGTKALRALNSPGRGRERRGTGSSTVESRERAA